MEKSPTTKKAEIYREINYDKQKLNAKIIARIEQARKENGYTQAQLAASLGISSTAWALYVAKKRKLPATAMAVTFWLLRLDIGDIIP